MQSAAGVAIGSASREDVELKLGPGLWFPNDTDSGSARLCYSIRVGSKRTLRLEFLFSAFSLWLVEGFTLAQEASPACPRLTIPDALLPVGPGVAEEVVLSVLGRPRSVSTDAWVYEYAGRKPLPDHSIVGRSLPPDRRYEDIFVSIVVELGSDKRVRAVSVTRTESVD